METVVKKKLAVAVECGKNKDVFTHHPKKQEHLTWLVQPLLVYD